jgi:hypothetical protein
MLTNLVSNSPRTFEWDDRLAAHNRHPLANVETRHNLCVPPLPEIRPALSYNVFLLFS